jgi:signal peptidase II
MLNSQLILKRIPWLLLGLAFFLFILDQATKQWAHNSFEFQEISRVTSFFYFTLRFNPGAAFSFLAEAGGWQRWLFTAIALGMSLFLVVWMTRSYAQPKKRLEALALALILSGALGNLYDRIMLGHVIDFIVFHYQQYEWPAFNIADVAICVGGGLLVLDLIIGHKKQDE